MLNFFEKALGFKDFSDLNWLILERMTMSNFQDMLSKAKEMQEKMKKIQQKHNASIEDWDTIMQGI